MVRLTGEPGEAINRPPPPFPQPACHDSLRRKTAANVTPGTDIGENAMRHLLRSIALIAGIVGIVSPSAAKIQKFEITRVDSPAFEGRSFGAVGTYDRIIARATIAVVSGRSPQFGYCRYRPRAAQPARRRASRGRCRDLAADDRRQWQSPAVLRGRQPRRQTRAGAVQRLPSSSTIPSRLRCRQRLSDEPRLHDGVERLAGRHRSRRRTDDVLAAHCARYHRPRARGLYLRPHATIRPWRR